jgi:hypothetical protein
LPNFSESGSDLGVRQFPRTSHQLRAHSHFHKVVITLLQIGLGQANSHWNHSSLLDAGSLDPISRGHGPLLVENMLERGRSCIDESRNGSDDGDLDEHHGA